MSSNEKCRDILNVMNSLNELLNITVEAYKNDKFKNINNYLLSLLFRMIDTSNMKHETKEDFLEYIKKKRELNTKLYIIIKKSYNYKNIDFYIHIYSKYKSIEDKYRYRNINDNDDIIKARFISSCLRSEWATITKAMTYEHRFTLFNEIVCYNNHVRKSEKKYDPNIGIYDNFEMFLLDLEIAPYTDQNKFNTELNSLDYDKVKNSFNKILYVNDIICDTINDNLSPKDRERFKAVLGRRDMNWLHHVNSVIIIFGKTIYDSKFIEDVNYLNEFFIKYNIDNKLTKLETSEAYGLDTYIIDPMKLLFLTQTQIDDIIKDETFIDSVINLVTYAYNYNLQVKSLKILC